MRELSLKLKSDASKSHTADTEEDDEKKVEETIETTLTEGRGDGKGKGNGVGMTVCKPHADRVFLLFQVCYLYIVLWM